MGTQTTSTDTGQHAELLKGQLHGFGLNLSSQPEPKGASRKGRKARQPSIPEYQQLVVLLQKRVKKAETENVAFRDQQQRLTKRCKIQRKLISHLREQMNDQTQQISELKKRVVLPEDNSSREFRNGGGRVLSLNSALLRISGVEVPQEPVDESQVLASQSAEAIDLEEFQPIQEIDDQQTVFAKLNHLNGQWTAKFSTLTVSVITAVKAGVAKFKIDDARLLGDGVVGGIRSAFERGFKR